MPAYKDKKRKTWYYSTYPPKNYPGERKKKMARGFRTKGEALEAEREYLNECERVIVGDVTVKEVMEHMLKFKESAPSTQINTRSMYKNHYHHIVKDTPIKNITTDDVMKLKEYLKSLNNHNNTKRIIFMKFGTIFEHAMIHFNLPFNPVKRVKGFRKIRNTNNYMTMDELYNNVHKIKDVRSRRVTIVLANTGLRIGELTALTWHDVNLKERYFDIHKKYNRLTGQIEDFTKTEASTAYVYFPQIVYDILVDIRNEDVQYLKYFNDDYYIFGGMRELQYQTYRQQFQKVFPNHRIQDLRHTYASYLRSVGIEYEVMKEALRHDDIATTINTYTHNYTDATKEVISKLDEVEKYHASITERINRL